MVYAAFLASDSSLDAVSLEAEAESLVVAWPSLEALLLSMELLPPSVDDVSEEESSDWYFDRSRS